MSTRKVVLLSAVAATVLLCAVLVAYIAGKGISGSFLSGKSAQAEQLSESARESGMDEQESSIQEGTQQSDAAGQEQTAESSGSQEVETSEENQPDETRDGGEKKLLKTVKVKAVYLTGTTAGNEKSLDHFIELVNNTELNALVIDIKENGIVNYESNVPAVKDNGLYRKVYDVDKIIKKLHDNNIYVIGRIVCFRDNELSMKRHDLAVKRPDGSLWREGKLGSWTNPYMEENWQYNIDIAKEAVEKGFDEIQFDYVRFPTAGKNEVYYGSNPPNKGDTIYNFLKRAKEELHDGMGVPVSADVFGIIAECPSDGEAIGQVLEKVGKDIDYISPMIYPSHYANSSPKGYMGNGKGQTINGILFTHPDLKPYEVVYNTLVGIRNKIAQIESYNATVRPFLQDFTASYLPEGYYKTYGPEEVRQQIKAVYDAGYEEWIFWDARNTYSEAGFKKE